MDFQLHVILKNLSEYFDPTLKKDEIIDSFENTRKCDEDLDSDTESETNSVTTNFNDLNLIRKVKENTKCTEILTELISSAFQTRQTPGIFFCEQDSWEFISNHICIKDYKIFINCLILLCRVDYLEKCNRKLSCLAARSYMLMLMTPGAKPKKVFDSQLILECMRIFDCNQYLRTAVAEKKIDKSDLVEMQTDLVSFLVELKTVLRHISLDTYIDVLKCIISTMAIIIRDNYKHGYDSIYAYHMTMESYKVLEVICTATSEKIDQILSIMMAGTCCLYFYTTPPQPEDDVVLPENTEFDGSITQFILLLLHKQPSHMMQILELFIKTVITNRDESLTDDEYNLFLDACVQYDTAMYKNFASTLLPHLEEALLLKNSKHRCAVISVLNKMLKQPTIDNLAYLSRDLSILKIIMGSMIDIDNNVKIAAMSTFLATLRTGNDNCLIIFEMAIKKRADVTQYNLDENDVPDSAAEINNSIVSEKSIQFDSKTITTIFPVTKSSENSEININALDEAFSQLLRHLLHHFDIPNVQVRILALEILEWLILKNHDVIECVEVQNYITALPMSETVTKVKKQLIALVNNVIGQYPNSECALKMYGEVVIDLIGDRDRQCWTLAVDSIKTNIFDCIKTYELSGNVVNIRPWLFFGIIFCSNFRDKFFDRMDLLIKQNVINQKVLSTVESHLSTSNSAEAWTVIFFLSKKVKSRNPEHVISAFKDIIINPEIVRSEVYDIVFQVMNTWVEDFAVSTLQKLQEMLRDIIHSCSSEAHVMSNLYNFANKAYKLCHKTIDVNWVVDIYEDATNYILNNLESFMENDKMEARFSQKLYIFSESCTDLPNRPNPRVAEFLKMFLTKVEAGDIPVENINYEAKICIAVTILTRLALRDSGFALGLMANYVSISKLSENNYNVTSNLAHCYRDLIIKFGILMERTLKPLAAQIRSKFPKIRLQALSFLAEIIMRDITKMTNLLLYQIFLGVVDDDKDISDLAKNLVLSYVEHRNNSLLRECFLDTVFVVHKFLHFSQFTFSEVGEIKRNETIYQWPDGHWHRFVLYNFIIESMDVIEAYKMFEWIPILILEADKKEFQNAPNAKIALKDILYILRKLCFQLVVDEEAKLNPKKGTKDEDNDDNNEIEVDKELKELLKTAKPKESVEQIISTISLFYDKILSVFPEYKIPLDRLMEAIFICFQDMIPEALTFFSPYTASLKTKAKAAKEKSAENFTSCTEKNDRLRLVTYLVRKERDLPENYFYRRQIR